MSDDQGFATSGQSEGMSPEPAPQQQPPGTPTALRPKKRKGCLVAFLVIVLLLVAACGGGALLLSRAARPDTATYSEADFDGAVTKLGLAWPQLPEGANPDEYERVYTGSKPMDATLSAAELSALMSYRHGASYWPIKSMDVELTGGNTASVSGVVSYMGRDWPVSASGSGSISGSALSLDVASAKVMGFEVPAQYLPYGADFLEKIINPRLARAGISVDSLEVTDQGVHLVGTTWATAEYVKK